MTLPQHKPYIALMRKLASNIEEQEDTSKKKKKKRDIPGIFDEFKGRPLRDTLSSDPEKWNRRTEMDILPVPGTRAALISVLGALLGIAYGTGKYYKDTKDPKIGNALAHGAGYGTLGWGMASSANAISHLLGFVGSTVTEPRTKNEQKEFDSTYRPLNWIPGLDMYNLYKREHTVDD